MSSRTGYRCLVLLAAICLASTGAFAKAYVGASAGSSNTEMEDSGVSFDGSGTAFKIQGGYRFMKHFGVEGDYRDFGNQDDNIGGLAVELDTTSLDVFAVGVLPVGRAFEVFGKAGWTNWDAKLNVPGVGSASDSGTDLAYGLGAAYAFGKFDLRLEYEQFDMADIDSVSTASFGFDWRF